MTPLLIILLMAARTGGASPFCTACDLRPFAPHVTLFCSIVQLRRQFNLAVNRANAPESLDHSSKPLSFSRSSVHQHNGDDDSSSYDSLNCISVEDHINTLSQTSQRPSSVPDARASFRRSPNQVPASDDDDEAADARHYRDLLSSITSNMRENRLGGGGIDPFEVDHTSPAPVPAAASFNPYPAPMSRSHTRVSEGSSGRPAILQKSSKITAAAVADTASAAHAAYARPFSGSSGADSLRPFDVAAVEERMQLMRQSYLDQVRAIAGAQAKAFTINAPESMSARRMSQLATPGGQLRSMKGYRPFPLSSQFALVCSLSPPYAALSTCRDTAPHSVFRLLHCTQASH